MRYAFFLGCKIPYFLPNYETSTRYLMSELGVDLVDIEFNCCGYPMRHLYFDSYILAAARSMAIAEKYGLDIVTPCKCCFGSLKRSEYMINNDTKLKEMVAVHLEQEGLIYSGRHRVLHLFSVLYHDIGIDLIKEKIKRPFINLKVAVMYGCHALRPSRMTQFDNPWTPSIIDRLVEATGAISIDWPGRLLCCGSPLRDFNEKISMAMIKGRLTESHGAGADVFVIGCPYSGMQSEWAYKTADILERKRFVTGTILYPQFLGLSMGLDRKLLGLTNNIPDSSYIFNYLQNK